MNLSYYEDQVVFFLRLIAQSINVDVKTANTRKPKGDSEGTGTKHSLRFRVPSTRPSSGLSRGSRAQFMISTSPAEAGAVISAQKLQVHPAPIRPSVVHSKYSIVMFGSEGLLHSRSI
jgi:hypothetical protein